jgi:hypothetical protein
VPQLAGDRAPSANRSPVFANSVDVLSTKRLPSSRLLSFVARFAHKDRVVSFLASPRSAAHESRHRSPFHSTRATGEAGAERAHRARYKTYRDEVLDAHVFESIGQVREVT